MNNRHFAEWIIRSRWAIIVGVFLIVAFVASGARRLGFSTDYRGFFSKENPQLQAFERLQNIYTKNDNILFAIVPKEGDVFSHHTLAVVEALTKASWQIPFSLRVDSLTNFQHTRADGDELIVEDLVRGAVSFSSSDLNRVRKIALSEPFLVNRLLSPSGRITGVNVTIGLPGESLGEVPSVVQYARELAEEIRRRYDDVDVYLSGMVMMDNAFNEASQQDMSKLVPVMFLILVFMMGLLLRSFYATIATILVIFLSTAAAMGLAGWFGILLSPPSASAPTVIMTLAIADSIHILVTLLQEMRRGSSKHDALITSLRVNIQPVFLTSLTTAIGFLSMNFSDAPPFHDLGNIVAMGVTAAFLLSIVFLPAVISVFPIRVKEKIQAKGKIVDAPFMDRFGETVVRHRRALLRGTAIFILIFLSGIPLIRLDDQFVDYFDDRYSFRRDTDFIVENLTGIYRIDYSLASGEEGGVNDPAYLAGLASFATWYRQQPGVLHVSTIVETMKRLNRNMHGDDPAYDRLPEDRQLAAQYLLLYELSLPFGLDLNNQINLDKSETRMTVTLKNLSSKKVLELDARAQGWLKENHHEEMQTVGAGPTIMFAHIAKRNIELMLRGTVFALVLISLILIFAFKSVRIGLVSLIPNLIPAGMAFGLWGMLVGRVGVATSIITAMSFGIVVDDTVHFLSKYLRARRELHLGASNAVRYAFRTVGTAIWVTSAILMAGFFILTFSGFAINAQLGLLTSITIAFALTADLLFLPPFLIFLEGSRTEDEAAPPDTTTLEGEV
ncbi:MAG: RND family transporter [Nitrospiria bacterium]